MKYSRSLFIFRRDLRLDDNTALSAALNSSKEIIPCFILDPRQIETHEYQSLNAIQFMVNSLIELSQALRDRQGKLFLFRGEPKRVLKELLEKDGINAVYVNEDYTPFSRERDEGLNRISKRYNIPFHSFGDTLLHRPGTVIKDDGKSYSVFSPFYKRALKLEVPTPKKIKRSNFFSSKLCTQEFLNLKEIPRITNGTLSVKGGRKESLSILSSLKRYSEYADDRDYPARNLTTHLSAHLKFGTVSVREVYHKIRISLGENHPILRQLYWRDFFTHIAFHYPYVFEGPFHKKFKTLPWSRNRARFNRWCNGETGFPIVDAGMRELNTTGFMHNRVRMIVGSFLTKDLHIDWRWGERYFATKLVDYDPAVNNGNWQWVASTGCDAQPYFRIFNPWLQQKRFDPACAYIKRWVPELKAFPPKYIHNIWKKIDSSIPRYPRPMVNHSEEASVAEEMFN